MALVSGVAGAALGALGGYLTDRPFGLVAKIDDSEAYTSVSIPGASYDSMRMGTLLGAPADILLVFVLETMMLMRIPSLTAMGAGR